MIFSEYFNMNQHEVWKYADPRRNVLLLTAREREAWRPRTQAQYKGAVPAPEQMSANIHCDFQFFTSRKICYFARRFFYQKILFIVSNQITWLL